MLRNDRINYGLRHGKLATPKPETILLNQRGQKLLVRERGVRRISSFQLISQSGTDHCLNGRQRSLSRNGVPRERISRIASTRPMLDSELKPRNEFRPARLTPREHFLILKENERVVICDDGQTHASLQIAPPFLESLDDTQELLLSSTIVDLS